MKPILMLGGISAADFYELTFAEAADFLKCRLRDNARNMYDAAAFISSFVALQLGGKRLPDISTLYPTLFTKPEEDYEKNEALFRQFAAQFNAQRVNK